MTGSGSNRKVANSLVAMGSAAVLAVYSAGYVRTRSAADRLSASAWERRVEREAPPSAPAPAAVPEPVSPAKHIPPIRLVEHKPQAPLPPPEKSSPVPPPVEAPAAAAPISEPAPAPAAPAPAAPAVEPLTEGVPPAAPSLPAVPAAKVWRDGKYQGWGSCRHGDIQATVSIQDGKIVSAIISECQTRYPCDVIQVLPGQVTVRQSANVQRIGGATESSDAFYWAVTEALKQAK